MKPLYVLLLSLLFAATAACAMPLARAIGDWHGTMTTPGGELAVVVRITQQPNGFGGNLESVDQAPGELIPLADVKADDTHLAFEVPSIKASFTGTWDASASAWSGTWMQSSYKFPLILKPGLGASVVKGMDGVWQAKVRRGDRDYRLVVRIQTTGDNTAIKFDAPDANIGDLAVTGFTRQGNNVRFEVPTAGAKFEGTLAQSGDHMDGTWFFPGQPPTQVSFARTTQQARQAQRQRPQTPLPPFPYRVEEVRIPNPKAPDVTLACSLTLPQGQGPFAAAVMLTGSGPQDRDETLFGHKFFAVIADRVTRDGLAVLRCDDRGFGASTGAFDKATTLDFATDADAEVAYLTTRPDIRKNAIGLIGHSEGALVAFISASANRSVDFLVSLAGPGTDLREMLLAQRHLLGEVQGAPKEWLNATQPVMAKIFDAVATSQNADEAVAHVRALLTPETCALLKLDAAHADLFVQTMTGVWMRQFLRLDLPSYLGKVTVPVLALAGSMDRQVAPDANLAALKSGLSHSRDLTVQKLDGLNHFFQHTKTGAFTEVGENEETFAPAALDAMSSWLKPRFLR